MVPRGVKLFTAYTLGPISVHQYSICSVCTLASTSTERSDWCGDTKLAGKAFSATSGVVEPLRDALSRSMANKTRMVAKIMTNHSMS